MIAEGERGQTQRNAFTAGPTFFFVDVFSFILVYLVAPIVVVVLLSAQFRLLKFAALLSGFFFFFFSLYFRYFFAAVFVVIVLHSLNCEKAERTCLSDFYYMI